METIKKTLLQTLIKFKTLIHEEKEEWKEQLKEQFHSFCQDFVTDAPTACDPDTEPDASAAFEEAVPTISRSADAIIDQDECLLETYGLPTCKAILEMEARAEKARGSYILLKEIRQMYFMEGGIKSSLESILDIAEYLPDGAQRDCGADHVLPLHSMVWNTMISTLIRKQNQLTSKVQKLSDFPDASSASEDPSSEIRKIRSNSNGVTEELCNSMERYIRRMNSAEEEYVRYAALVSEDQIHNVMNFAASLDQLLTGSSCTALSDFSVFEGETETDNDGEAIIISNTTYEYWKKVISFSAEVNQFVKDWEKI